MKRVAFIVNDTRPVIPARSRSLLMPVSGKPPRSMLNCCMPGNNPPPLKLFTLLGRELRLDGGLPILTDPKTMIAGGGKTCRASQGHS
jgi:hypothetical protein